MKQNEKLSHLMTDLDDRYLEEAEKTVLPAKHFSWKKFTTLAAGLVLVAGICTLPFLGKHNGEVTPENKTLGERYTIVWDAEKGIFTYSAGTLNVAGFGFLGIEGALTNPEIVTEPTIDIGIGKPTTTYALSLHGRYPYTADEAYLSYNGVNGTLAVKSIGKQLGSIQMANAAGKTVHADVYAINGIDPAFAVAVRYEDLNSYYPYTNGSAEFASFAAYKRALSLDTALFMGSVLVQYSYPTATETYLEPEEITPLKEMILALDGTPCTYNDFVENRSSGRIMGIALSHTTLRGIGSQGLQLFEDGYLMTNLGGVLHVFEVEEERVRDIIDYAEKKKLADVNFYESTEDVFENRPIVPGGNSEDNPETTAAAPYQSETTSGAYTQDGLTTPSHDSNKDAEDLPAVSTMTEESTRLTETEIALETAPIPD